MITSNELRIGNLLLLKGVVHKIACIHNDETVRFISNEDPEENHGCYGLANNYWDIQPMPLTPEILEKAGFEHEKGVMAHPIDSLFITQDNVFYIGEVLMIDMQHPIKRIDYVHELQNLYYALTGTELTILI